MELNITASLGSACTLCFIAINCAAVTCLGINSSLSLMPGLQPLAPICGFHQSIAGDVNCSRRQERRTDTPWLVFMSEDREQDVVV
jgi:hypothetical protein